MNITTSDLRAVFDHFLTFLEENGYSTISIPADYYWNIPKEQRYDSYEEPSEFDLGQLTDDWMELNNLLNGKRETTRYALIWLSTILRAIGELGNE